jgi:hypothetical protein
MLTSYYQDSINAFLTKGSDTIFGELSRGSSHDIVNAQKLAWRSQIEILKEALKDQEGVIFFEFSVPRMGKRIDALVIIEDIVFVIEFKVGESSQKRHDNDQVWDYALDLKNFHKPSHHATIIPILLATEAMDSDFEFLTTAHNDKLLRPIFVNKSGLKFVIDAALARFSTTQPINGERYVMGEYSPTPTIVEAAVTLYRSHSVDNITRSGADATALKQTTTTINDLIKSAQEKGEKAICFVTGVPGAGKTLVGLKVATAQLDNSSGTASVYLSGNAPLVAILQEALARDKVQREKAEGKVARKGEAKQAVKTFVQNIHHYRDEYVSKQQAPYDHVAIFDEAQRAWNKEQTVGFMHRKKGIANFSYSEPEFLISCLDRHDDWAVVICLVGGGQEINTGEAGISEWLNAVSSTFKHWQVYISPHLTDSEYNAQDSVDQLSKTGRVHLKKELHLSASMRSFRARDLSLFVKNILDIRPNEAQEILQKVDFDYPLVLTRDLAKAKSWLREMARGNERYGIVVSSQAQRLKPLAIDVRPKINPVNWFLDGRDDVRSSYYLEDVATEFDVQGLELDWSCVTWDGDLRFIRDSWNTFSFKGNKWQRIMQDVRKRYLINAYRVLLTRARQGMVIVVPEGDKQDHTRLPEFYDSTFHYLQSVGIRSL